MTAMTMPICVELRTFYSNFASRSLVILEKCVCAVTFFLSHACKITVSFFDDVFEKSFMVNFALTKARKLRVTPPIGGVPIFTAFIR